MKTEQDRLAAQHEFRHRLAVGEFIIERSGQRTAWGVERMLLRCLEAFHEMKRPTVACSVMLARLNWWAQWPGLFGGDAKRRKLDDSSDEQRVAFVIAQWKHVVDLPRVRASLNFPDEFPSGNAAVNWILDHWYLPFEQAHQRFMAHGFEAGSCDPRPLILCAIDRGFGLDGEIECDPIAYVEARRRAMFGQEDLIEQVRAVLKNMGNGLPLSPALQSAAKIIAARFSARLKRDGPNQVTENQVISEQWILANVSDAERLSLATFVEETGRADIAPGTTFKESRVEDRLFPPMGKRRKRKSKTRDGSSAGKSSIPENAESGRTTSARWRDSPLNEALRASHAAAAMGGDLLDSVEDSASNAENHRVAVIRAIREYRRRNREDKLRRAASRWILDRLRERPSTYRDLSKHFGVSRSSLEALLRGAERGEGLAVSELHEIVKRISES